MVGFENRSGTYFRYLSTESAKATISGRPHLNITVPNPGRRPATRPALDALGQRGLHELVEIAVEHVGRAGVLDPCAQVLHQLVGLQHICERIWWPQPISDFDASVALAAASRFFSSSS